MHIFCWLSRLPWMSRKDLRARTAQCLRRRAPAKSPTSSPYSTGSSSTIYTRCAVHVWRPVYICIAADISSVLRYTCRPTCTFYYISVWNDIPCVRSSTVWLHHCQFRHFPSSLQRNSVLGNNWNLPHQFRWQASATIEKVHQDCRIVSWLYTFMCNWFHYHSTLLVWMCHECSNYLNPNVYYRLQL